jgi:hypothetical protein
MKEYLKMSKHFTGDVTIDYNGNICDGKSYFGSTDIAEDYYEHVCHAINSHDELVEEVDRLRGLIERIISSAQELAKKMPSTEFGDGYKQCAMDTASAIESRTNKGA